MFDFNFFRRRTAKEYMETAAETYEVPQVSLPNTEPAYQVGKTEDGKTTLRIGYSTLTMTNAGVDQLMRMLTAAKENDTE